VNVYVSVRAFVSVSVACVCACVCTHVCVRTHVRAGKAIHIPRAMGSAFTAWLAQNGKGIG